MGEFKYILWWLLLNTQGGENRANILRVIFRNPSNAHELCNILNLNYKTIRYHLDILEKNKIILGIGEKYGKTYFPSEKLKDLEDYFNEIMAKFVKKVDKEG
jgi:predicted transcriptional regulator